MRILWLCQINGVALHFGGGEGAPELYNSKVRVLYNITNLQFPSGVDKAEQLIPLSATKLTSAGLESAMPAGTVPPKIPKLQHHAT